MNLRLDPVRETEFDNGALMGDNDDVERRQHTRSLRVMRVARVVARDLNTEGLGMVRDVSPGGMMIDAQLDLDLGQPVSIALLDDQELSGTVAWKDGNMLGVQFAEEIPVERILVKPSLKRDGQRTRLPRFAVQKDVELKIDNVVIEAKLQDISQRGAKLQCGAKLRIHGNLLVRAQSHKPVAATVKWRAGEMVGVEFHRLLGLDELDQWLSFSL
jgi:hypothetical protein